MGTGPIGGGGGSFDYNYFFPPKKKKETTDGTEGSEAVVPRVTEAAQANPPKKSDGSVTSTGDTGNSGLGGRQRGGDPGLYKKPQPQQVRPTTDEEATEPPKIVDELTLSNEALATQPPLDPARAAYEAEAHKHPPEEFQGDEGNLDLKG
jgi:hypothetical protein